MGFICLEVLKDLTKSKFETQSWRDFGRWDGEEEEFCYKGEQRNEAVLEEVLGQVRLLQDGGDIYILMGMIPKKGKTNDAGERTQMKEKILEYARCYGIQYMSWRIGL